MNKNLITNSSPKVSIIMSCYNGEQFLIQALNSILNQSYTNWELIFWDNQSYDSSALIFKKFKDTRFKYFYANKHTQISEARNRAIEKASGEILSFLDVDDFWLIDKLTCQVKLFEDESVGIVYGNFFILNQDTNKIRKFFNKTLPRGRIVNNLLKDHNVGFLTLCIRKFFYDQLEYKFHEDLVLMGDTDLVIRLSLICNADVVQEPIATYRYHNQSFTIKNKEIIFKELDSWLKKMNDCRNTLLKNNFDLVENFYAKSFFNNLVLSKQRYEGLKFIIFKKMSYYIKLKCIFVLLLPLIIIKIIRKR